MNNELLMEYYFMGWELSKENEPFPAWFETYEEKAACLLGYTDCDLGISREKQEILEKIKKNLDIK